MTSTTILRPVLAAIAGLGIAGAIALPAVALATPYGELPAPEPALEEGDVVGWWCPAQETGEVVAAAGRAYQVQIVGQTEGYVVLGIMCTTSGSEMGSANAMGTIVAPVVDGVALFSFCDGQGRIYDARLELDADALHFSVVEKGAYQTLAAYETASLAFDGDLGRDLHHAAKTDSIGWSGSQLQPTSSEQELSEEMLRYSSPLLLELERNEIYARHGYIFETDYLTRYFSEKSWYEPTTPADQFDESVLNDVERANVELLRRIQDQWESLSNGTTFVATAGTYRVPRYGDAWNEDVPMPGEAQVSFDGDATVLIAFGGGFGDPAQNIYAARIVDDGEAVIDVEGGQIVATWSSPGTFFTTWRGAGAVPAELTDIVYQSFTNEAYVAVG